MSDDDIDDTDVIGVKRSEPLSLRWRFGGSLPEALELPTGRNQKQRMAIERIAALAYKVMRKDPAGEISFGRSKSDYAGMRHYQGDAFTCDNILGAIDALASDGLVTENRARPGSRGWRSTVQGTPALAERIASLVPAVTPVWSPVLLIYDPLRTIRLRDQTKRLVKFRETEFSRTIGRRLEGINEMNRSLQLAAPGTMTEPGVYQCTNAEGQPVTADLRRKEYHRVFNWDFGKGGRFYGVGWQGLPKEVRAQLTIDGERVSETDFPMLHAVLLYAHIGKAPPAGSFDLPDWPRWMVKLAFYTMVNADSAPVARGAIQLEIMRARLAQDGMAGNRTGDLMRAIERKHTAVKPYFYSGIGRVLQRHDSDIAEGVILDAQGDGIATLSVHDSFIAKERHSDQVRELMDAHLFQMVRQINSDTPAPQPVPPLVLVLPEGSQPDLFGRMTVPVSDLSRWQHGVMPPTVRAAVRHEIRRRCLRQDDAAAEVGISRPQFTNALQGRFGVSESVADRIKAMIRDAAA